MPAGMVLLLRSRDGDIFEVDDWILDLSPVLSSTDTEEEIPLPLVGSGALKILLAHCKEFQKQGRWTLSRRLSMKQVEELFGAAHGLALEHLGALCAARLANGVQEQAQISLPNLLRVLQMRLRLPPLALQAVVTAAASGGLEALEVIARHRSHSSSTVRAAVARAMCSAPRGHPVTRWLPKRLQLEEAEDVQLELLRSIASTADGETFSQVLPFMAPHHKVELRLAAVHALRLISPSGPSVLAALIGAGPVYSKQGLEDRSVEVRLLALRALREDFSDCRAVQVIKATAHRLHDDDMKVREEAIKTLSCIAGNDGGKGEEGNAAAIQLAVECLKHKSSSIRSAGIRALRQIARGNWTAISSILHHLDNPDVRNTACLALMQVTTSLEAVHIVLSCLGTPTRREAVFHCLQLLRANLPSKWFARCLANRLPKFMSHKEPPTRLAALRALTLVNPRLVVRPRLLRSVGLRLLDKDRAVRAEAYRVARRAPPKQILAPLVAHLAYGGRQKLVTQAFGTLANPSCFALLLPALTNPRPQVGRAAIHILSQSNVPVEEMMHIMAELLKFLENGISVRFECLATFLHLLERTQVSVNPELMDFTSRLLQPRLQPSGLTPARVAWASCIIAMARLLKSSDMTPGAFEEFLRHLLQMLKNDQLARQAAILALPFVFPTRHGSEAVEAVANLLYHRCWQVRWTAAAALIGFDPENHQVKPHPPELCLTIRKSLAAKVESDLSFVRDVAKDVSQHGLEGNHQLCRQAWLISLEVPSKRWVDEAWEPEIPRKFARLRPKSSGTCDLD
ncbi:unnamed protein product [Durusdinium trenchii]|uniref:Uncharacterized protein n=3 Tax=Durusdinium trenchii TaxID=1381693 RepID=A0ABP0JK01_9DINO